MPPKPSESQRLANSVSRLLYGVAGWLMIGLGALGIVTTFLWVIGDSAAANPVFSAVAMLISVVFVLSGVLVNPQLRRRLNRRHSLTKFGQVRSVDERVLHASEGQTERCVNCRSRLNEGLVRHYREEVCFAGIPVFTRSQDDNYYCVECATTELGASTLSDSVQVGPENESKNDAQLATERR